MNYIIFILIFELLNLLFDNYNNVKFGENFVENLFCYFVFLWFILLE